MSNEKKIFQTEDFIKSPHPQPPSSNRWKWLVAALVVLVLVGGIYWYANRSSMTESASAKIVADSTNTDSTRISQTDTTKVQQTTDTVQNAQNEGNTVSNANSVPDKKQVTNNKTNASTNSESASTEKINTDAGVVNIEAKARQVIRGDFGNGSVRKLKLGSEYTSIQNKVNEMYRTGAVR